DDAREKGIEIGRQEGIQISEERGRQKGIQIGHEKGRKEREIEVAKNLLKAGVSIDIIAQTTGLPKAEIARLKGEVTS
ncbi:MAG: transposase, partial [Wolbachia endosymbiont of Penenirmus auritus]|nr:transposase [Wolbachia endosymbiont of Penenirmus auritus]